MFVLAFRFVVHPAYRGYSTIILISVIELMKALSLVIMAPGCIIDHYLLFLW